MAYGDKTDYPKIDIQYKRKDGRWYYICSTTWSPTCEDAATRFIERNETYSKDDIRATFKDSESSVAGRNPKGTEI